MLQVADTRPFAAARDRLVTTLLADPRDWPLLACTVRAAVLVPLALSVYVAQRREWMLFVVLAAAHLAVYVYHLEPFITMYHDVNHRRLFRRERQALTAVLHWLIAPLYGLTPNTYYIHHVLMHHPSDNMSDDVSTTLQYRRDSPMHFLRYYWTFMVSHRKVSAYMRQRYHRSTYSRRLIVGELLHVGVVGVLLWWAPLATLIVFLIPLLVTRSLLIIGNWAEHAFIDPWAPGNLFRNSTNLLGAANARAFNVGYHIDHHLRPSAHFSTHPEHFRLHQARFGREDAVVLQDLNYPQLWWLLMTHRYRTLADRLVELPGAPARSREEKIAMLKSRVVPIVDVP